MDAVIILSLGLLVYAFVVYPLILNILAKRNSVPGMLNEQAGYVDPPSVSILLAAYNEVGVMREKIANFLALDYPPERLELLIISDGSDDGTDELVRTQNAERVRLLRQEGRLGKTSALNMGVAEAKGAILFFSDADSMLQPNCLSLLMQAFSDPAVGLASGRCLYADAEGRETAGGLYRRYEGMLKEREGKLFGIVGADGPVYAMRKDLYHNLPPEYINDLVHPVQVVLAGQKAVSVPKAIMHEPGAESLGRQTRIMAQSWLIFFAYLPLLITRKRYGFLWQFISHKVIRWLALPLMALALLAALWGDGFLSALTLVGFAGLSALAGLGATGKGGRLPKTAWLFILQGVSAMLGLYRLRKGDKFVTWSPRGN